MTAHNIKITKKNRESVAGMLRRFTLAVRKSGLLFRAREVSRASRNKSEYVEKKEALKRIAWQKEMGRLRKLGKIE
ncbi:MAG: hypothetical protein AAB378_02100 [Patescibacteria group bacterium]